MNDSEFKGGQGKYPEDIEAAGGCLFLIFLGLIIAVICIAGKILA